MTAASVARLDVFADLQLVADGQRASLVGDGRVLTFTAQAPQQLWSTLQHLPLPDGIKSARGVRAVGKIADALGEQELELHIVGPAGELAHLGRGARSWWGPLVTGSGQVSVGSVSALRPMIAASVRQSRLFWPAVAVAATGVVAAAWRSWSGRLHTVDTGK